MKKKYLQLIILLAVFALIMIGYVISSSFSENDSDATENDIANDELVLVDLNYTNVTSVSYKRNGETVKILTDSSAYGTYSLDGDSEFPLDKTKAIAMTQAVATIECTRFVEDSVERFADYGLENPEYVISATYDTNTAITMNIGILNTFTGTRYMNVEGTNKVYMVSPAILDYFDYSKLELVTNDTKPVIGSDEITKIEIVKKSGASTVYTSTDGEWFVGNGQSANESKIDLIARAIMGIALNNCADYAVNEDAEIEKYGLLNPEITVSTTYVKESSVAANGSSSAIAVKTESTFTVLIGSTDSEGKSVYIKLPESELVYKANAELLSPLFE